MTSSHPSTARIWAYSTKSYSCFRDGPLNPDWLWKSKRFFDGIRRGILVAARDEEGDYITSMETQNQVARRLRCRWFGLDIVAHDSRHRIYVLVPRLRVPEVLEALGITSGEPASEGLCA